MRSFKLVVLVIAVIITVNLMCSATCFAQDPLRKLGRGFANATLGWLSFFSTIEDTGRSDGILAAATYGFLKGIWNAAQRTGVGFYEIVTFPIPRPKEYKPILTQPEFPLGKEAK